MAKILFVDDESSTLMMLKMRLSDIAEEMDFVDSGQKAIDYMSDPAKLSELKLLLLDLNMPDIDGFDVIKWMKENKIKVHTVLQTGIESKELKQKIKGYEDMVSGVLGKPYSNAEVLSCIKKYSGVG